MCEELFTGEAVRKLFVGGLDRSISDDELKEYFEKFGAVCSATVIKDSEKSSKGYGFVTFEEIDDVDTCLKSRPHIIGSKEAQVKHSIPRDDESNTAGVKTNKIFIGGVKNNTEEEIRTFFENPAFRLVIKSVEVKKDRETNVNRGFGFITLETDDMADKVHIARRIVEKKWDIMKAEPQGGGGGGVGGGRGRGRGGPRGAPRGGSTRRGRGRGGYEQRRGGYGGGGGGGYDGYNSGYSDGYGGGYDNYGSGGYSGGGGYGGGGYGGGGYGGGSYGGGGYGGGYDNYGGPMSDNRGRRPRPY